MPKLQTNSQREFRYKTIAEAEGDQCIACYIEKHVRRGPPKTKLIIEHTDNNQKNWAWGNLHLCCYSHNKKFEKMPVEAKVTLLQSYSDQLERERGRENLPTWKTIRKSMVPYEYGSPEMQANKKFEPRWLKYVHAEVKANGSVKKKDLIAGGAYHAHCSIQTSTNYLLKYASPSSPFMETLDDDGDKIIQYRQNNGYTH